MCAALEQKYFITSERGARGRTEGCSEPIRQQWTAVLFPVKLGTVRVRLGGCGLSTEVLLHPSGLQSFSHFTPLGLGRKSGGCCCCSDFPAQPFLRQPEGHLDLLVMMKCVIQSPVALQEQWRRDLGDNEGKPRLSAQIYLLMNKTKQQNHKKCIL